MTIYYEFRPHARRHGKVQLRTRQQCVGANGFISVCGYSEEVAEFIREQDGTYGLTRLPLYVDRAIMDFDDAERDYKAAVAKCVQEGWSFRSYNTGNRGYHIYIDIQPYHAIGAYRQMEAWLNEHFKGFDGCLYKSSSITRIPGTIHSKTGRRMELVEKGEGSRPDIKNAKISMPMPKVMTLDDRQDHIYFAEMFQSMLGSPVYSGDRHASVYRMAAVACKAGLSEEFIEARIKEWNRYKCKPALPDLDIVRAITNAKRSVSA